MLADGWPFEAVARRLGRSRWAVTAQAAKCGISVMRHGTKGEQLQLLPTPSIDKEARVRGVTANTYKRIIVELAEKSPTWRVKLVATTFEERNAADEPPAAAAKTKPAAEVVTEPTVPSPLVGTLHAPRLDGAVNMGRPLEAVLDGPAGEA
jgi:hypothetical protein